MTSKASENVPGAIANAVLESSPRDPGAPVLQDRRLEGLPEVLIMPNRTKFKNVTGAVENGAVESPYKAEVWSRGISNRRGMQRQYQAPSEADPQRVSESR